MSMAKLGKPIASAPGWFAEFGSPRLVAKVYWPSFIGQVCSLPAASEGNDGQAHRSKARRDDGRQPTAEEPVARAPRTVGGRTSAARHAVDILNRPRQR